MGNSSRVGLTRDSGWQVGFRKTVPAELGDVWSKAVSAEGLARWLGSGSFPLLELDIRFELEDGTACHVRVLKPQSHLRIGWHPPGWPRSSTIQVRCLEAKTGTTLAFHQEQMPDADAREQRREVFVQCGAWVADELRGA